MILVQCSNSFLTVDDWKSLLLTIIGAFLGFLFALWVARWQDNRQKKNYHMDCVRYFIELSNSAMKMWKNQLEQFKILGDNLKATPYEQHLLGTIASNDILRLESYNFSDLFHAVRYIFKKDNDKITQYSNLVKHIDYIVQCYKAEKLAAEKHLLKVHERQLNIKKAIDTLYQQLYHSKMIMEQNNPQFRRTTYYQFLEQFSTLIYRYMQTPTPFADYRDNVIEPMLLRLVRDFGAMPNAQNLLNLIYDAKTNYSHIQRNSNSNADAFLDIENNTKESINSIEEYTTNLKEKLDKKRWYQFWKWFQKKAS